MYAPVRHQTSRIIPEPTECEMKTVPIERTFRGRPQPHIIVHSGGHRLVRLDGDRGAPTLIREYTYGAYLTQLSAMYELHGVLPMRIATLPLAYLHDPVVFLRRPYHNVTFLDTISQRFLTIHILPGLASGYHLQAVPMIGSTYDYEIDILIVYQFTPVFI